MPALTETPTQTRCRAPAKLILSGEHSVLYNCPALSMAISLYAECLCQYNAHQPSQITIELDDFNFKQTFSRSQWHQQAVDIESRYQLFLNGNLAIQNVLQSSADLIICCLHHFEMQLAFASGAWHFKIHSEIPVGRGLGSSAAIITSVLKTLSEQHHIKPENSMLLELARTVESRQHGRSSGLDPATSLIGGLLKFQQGQTCKTMASSLKIWGIDSGAPQSTTGQAVSRVRQDFADNKIIWQAFQQTTEQMIDCLNQSQQDSLGGLIDSNQQLLEQIGVVPLKVAQFVKDLQQVDCHAKICGSGAIQGEQAGVILVVGAEPPITLCQKYNYTSLPIEIDFRGAHCQKI